MATNVFVQHETTASALTWCMYLLAKHSRIQSLLRSEIYAAIPDPNGPVSGALLESLPYLNGVCAEVFRLYPTVPITAREVMRPTTIAGHRIPAGPWIILCPYATNRDPKLWGNDASEFKPDRWIDVDEKTGAMRVNNHGGASSNYALMTFLHGPRSCIGQGFAKAELRCAVATLVGRYNIELENPNHIAVPAGSITQKPQGGLSVKLTLLDW